MAGVRCGGAAAARHLSGQHPDPRLLSRDRAITVDILWGYCGTLTFGQSGLFSGRVLCAAITFTEFGFGTWQALACARRHDRCLDGGGRADRLAVILSGIDAALCVDRVAGRSDRAGCRSSFRRHIHGSSSGLVGFETFVSRHSRIGFGLAGLSLIAVAVVALIVMRSDAGRLLTALRGQ